MSQASESTSIEPPEVTEDDIMYLEDERFRSENVALVTGGGSGIGRALAQVLAANGLTVAATDIDEEGLNETVQETEELGVAGSVKTVVGDLTDQEDLDKIVSKSAEFGSIKYLANIAGLQHVAPIEKFPMEKYDLMHQVMQRAPLYLSRQCLPHMRKSSDGTGAVGNMSSIHGHFVTKDKVAYNMTKFALRGLTQSIAAEGNGDVRAFSVSTGYVKTPLVTNQIPDTAEERGISPQEVVEKVMQGQSRVKEMMEPVDVANLFLLGFSRHAKHLNGGDLLFDGGSTLTYE